MWTYRIPTGWLSRNNLRIAQGYSGAPGHVDQVGDVCREDEGPVPPGKYYIGWVGNTPDHGPFVLSLTPAPTNDMHGRSGFLIHGDSIKNPGCASKGCIIMPLFARNRVWESEDHELQVLATP